METMPESQTASASVDTTPWDERPLSGEWEAILLAAHPNKPRVRMKERRHVWHMMAARESGSVDSDVFGQRPWDWGRVLDVDARITRGEYWVRMGVVLLLFIVYLVGGSLLIESGVPDAYVWLGSLVLWLMWLKFWFETSLNRIHDMGKGWAWVLLLLVPVVNVAVIIWLGSARSEPRRNPWGPPVFAARM